MSKKQETILDVMGMSCPSCVRHIDDALGKLAGVARVEVRLSDGRVVVQHDQNRTSIDDLVAALREAGYASSASAQG
jgi:copper chaperone